MQRLGHWALGAGLPVIDVLYAPFGPLALVMLLLLLYLHYLYLSSRLCLLLQGRCAFASKVVPVIVVPVSFLALLNPLVHALFSRVV